MSLFQHSVIKKYTQELDTNSVNTAFDKFQKHFGNPEIQQNIRNSKEEQYQEGFLRELFVNILGYPINPEPNYNLLTEQKNEKDSKKADGAILKHEADKNSVIAVIELKGTETTDLSKVENQAFCYKNNHKDCKYVITSNFEKLRFYIDNAIDFEEFNLFNLTKERFQLLFLCLSKDNLLNGIPQKIKEASVSQEENITKKLYSDYSTFKRNLYQNIVELNPQFDKLTLFKKTQKLLDRFLFIFFAEDRLLLPPNSIREIIKQWNQLKDLDNYTPLYDRFKKYFGYMNTGFKGKQYEIFAYNGGFFAPDDVLDNIIIDDTILHDHTLKLSNYDFDTEVDVNILGHIFEHSLNEIEEIKSEIEGKELDKSKSKRKKDGVFYTPKYITKYIVENTVGALCTEKKNEIGINNDEIIISTRKAKKKELIEKIDTYRDWLLKITICDPACGSGAFLNQALDFLISEHRKLDELKARITNSPLIFSDIENSILENNIFGVDINEEAVEIARLSLWLKTAQKGRKLTDLSGNIKCGNSLIDDKNIAGDKAFNWHKEFPQIFGFDNLQDFENLEDLKNKDEKPDFLRLIKEKTLEAKEKAEKAKELSIEAIVLTQKVYEYAEKLDSLSEPKVNYKLKNAGFDVIIGNPPYVQVNDSLYRNYSTRKCGDLYAYFFEKGLNLIKMNGYFSFITPSLFIKGMRYESLREYLLNNSKIIGILDKGDKVFQDVQMPTAITTLIKTKCDNQNWNTFISDNDLIQKINYNSKFIKEISTIMRGLEIGKDKVYNNRNDIQFITGEDIYRYGVKNFSYIDEITYKKFQKNNFFFEGNRVLIRETGSRITTFFLNDNITQNNRSLYSIKINDEQVFNPLFILSILNSNLIQFYYQTVFAANTDVFPKIRIGQVKEIPIIDIHISMQKPFIEKADIMLSKNKELQALKSKFIKLLTSKFSNLKITNKIENWSELDFGIFLKELEKLKIKLTLSDQSEWLDYFEKEKSKANELQEVIKKTDDEIDMMVYEIYGLTEEEIHIIENS